MVTRFGSVASFDRRVGSTRAFGKISRMNRSAASRSWSPPSQLAKNCTRKTGTSSTEGLVVVIRAFPTADRVGPAASPLPMTIPAVSTRTNCALIRAKGCRQVLLSLAGLGIRFGLPCLDASPCPEM